MSALNIKPRDQLVRLLQYVHQKESENALTAASRLYTFVIPHNPAAGHTILESVANNYIHRMRVELSRMRKKIRQRHKQLRDFSLLRRDVRAHPDGIQITLEYKRAGDDELQETLSDIFGLLSNGRPSMDHKAARGLPEEPAPVRRAPVTVAFGGVKNVKAE